MSFSALQILIEKAASIGMAASQRKSIDQRPDVRRQDQAHPDKSARSHRSPPFSFARCLDAPHAVGLDLGEYPALRRALGAAPGILVSAPALTGCLKVSFLYA